MHWLRLLRISLLPTALLDVWCGWVLAGGGNWLAALPVMLAGACFLHGGLLLNDAIDHERDAKERPERPLPSGQASMLAALLTGVALLMLGNALCGYRGEWWPLGISPLQDAAVLLSLLVMAYNLSPPTGRRWYGPLLLALCRATNLHLGLLAAGGTFLPGVGLAYAAWILLASRLAQREDIGATRQQLLMPLLLGMLVPLLFVSLGSELLRPATAAAVLLSFTLGFGALRRLQAAASPYEVQRLVGHWLSLSPLLLGIFLLDGPEPQQAVWALLAWASVDGLRRLFPVT